MKLRDSKFLFDDMTNNHSSVNCKGNHTVFIPTLISFEYLILQSFTFTFITSIPNFFSSNFLIIK